MLGFSKAEGSIPTEQERIALMNSMRGLSEGIMKAGGYPFIDSVDANYIPRETMAPDWSELDDYEAQELARLANMEQYPEEAEEGNNLPFNMSQLIASGLGRKLGLGWLAGIPGLLLSSFTGAGSGLGQGLSSLRGGHATQNAYEKARQNRILQGRKEYMMDRREKGLDYGNLANVFQQLREEDTWVPPQIRKPTAPQTYIRQPTGPQQQDGGGGIPQVARDLGMRGSYDHGWT